MVIQGLSSMAFGMLPGHRRRRIICCALQGDKELHLNQGGHLQLWRVAVGDCDWRQPTLRGGLVSSTQVSTLGGRLPTDLCISR